MRIHELKPHPKAKKKIKRVGRGTGSGHGSTAGRGHDGQNSRSGGGVRRGFEGGQTPLFRRVPKRGFNNKQFAEKYSVINVSSLNRFASDTEINPDLLRQEKLIDRNTKVKILGDGLLEKSLTVKAHKFTTAAKEKIEAAGGQVEVL